jgi:hypothetical protein
MKPSMAPPSGVYCSQCGLMHPPLNPGSDCPMKKEVTESGEVINLEKFFQSLKSVLVSNIKKKNIKNYKKLLAYILVKISKTIEQYNETEDLLDVRPKNGSTEKKV